VLRNYLFILDALSDLDSVGKNTCPVDGNCSKSPNCCGNELVCYQKDDFWADCRPEGKCVTGVHQDDPVEYRTPWSCKVLSGKEDNGERSEVNRIIKGKCPFHIGVPDGVDEPTLNLKDTITAALNAWDYTKNDAFLGRACQKDYSEIGGITNTAIRIERQMKKNFRKSEFDKCYASAYVKMMNFSAEFGVNGPQTISGNECPSGLIGGIGCSKCTSSYGQGRWRCPSYCYCSTGFAPNAKFSPMFD
jgi:hypothetical protein